ncbi:MAG: glycosyltransferase [Chloroflexi bacterium]|nr:glycosyltransferase [Chloroflexota bacterium]
MTSERRPSLSITIATHDGWPVARETYESLRAQSERAGAEVILVDGSDHPVPSDGSLGANVRWIRMPGSDIAEMRMRAYREASGDVIAMTDDHCIAAPDWIERMLNAHREDPDAAAIGGTVVNGSTDELIDWASFYAGHTPYLPPQPKGSAAYLSGADLSFKREALHAILDEHGDRAIEALINESLKARGQRLAADDSIFVTHYQSRGFLPTTLLHFFAGRNFEGTRRDERPREAPWRALRALLIPVPRALRRMRVAAAKQEPPARLAMVFPFVLWVAWAQAAGELAGALLGPGDSARRLH